MEITIEKILCEGCKGAFKELEKVALKFETQPTSRAGIRIFSVNLASKIDSIMDNISLGISDNEWEEMFKEMTDIIENTVLNEIYAQITLNQ